MCKGELVQYVVNEVGTGRKINARKDRRSFSPSPLRSTRTANGYA